MPQTVSGTDGSNAARLHCRDSHLPVVHDWHTSCDWTRLTLPFGREVPCRGEGGRTGLPHNIATTIQRSDSPSAKPIRGDTTTRSGRRPCSKNGIFRCDFAAERTDRPTHLLRRRSRVDSNLTAPNRTVLSRRKHCRIQRLNILFLSAFRAVAGHP